MCLCIVCVHTHVIVCTWESEDNLWVLVLSFYHVGPGDGAWVVRLDRKYVYLPRQVISSALPGTLLYDFF